MTKFDDTAAAVSKLTAHDHPTLQAKLGKLSDAELDELIAHTGQVSAEYSSRSDDAYRLAALVAEEQERRQE